MSIYYLMFNQIETCINVIIVIMIIKKKQANLSDRAEEDTKLV